MHAERKASILIVDDDVSLTRTTALILGRKGYVVATAQDGPEAIGKVNEHIFDIVLMDIKMPLMNGVETYRRIKQIRPNTVVIMMTAFAVEELIQEALQEGAYGIVYKPLDIDNVVALIEEAKMAKNGAFILVVDDDPGTSITLRSILTSKGYQVHIAQNGEEAITSAQEADYDVIFIDLKLPTINGLETYLAIRKCNPESIAIMMTAYRQEVADLVDEALRNDAYTCLYKPFAVEELLKLIDKILEKKRGHSLHKATSNTLRSTLDAYG